MRQTTRWIWIVLGLTLLPGATARVIRVDQGAQAADHDGSSWQRAYLTIGEALEGASNADEIWIAAGYYPENVYLRAGRSLYGGFDGTELSREERDWRNNVTVLDGQSRGSTVTVDGEKTRDEMIVDGFTIQNGTGTFLLDGPSVLGGGLYAVHTYFELRNCTFTRSSAGTFGGGVAVQGCRGLIENCVFTDNGSEEWGGGLYIEDSTTAVRASRFMRNAATSRGGALACFRSDVTLDNCVLLMNDARVMGGAVFAQMSTVRLTNNTVADNFAPLGGSLHLVQTSGMVENNIVAFNAAGFSQSESALVYRNNCVFGNLPGNYGQPDDPTGSDGNISEDPVFVQLASGDVRIQPSSPCRDSGCNSAVQPGWTDVAGSHRIRPAGGRVDIGAFESDGTPIVPPPHRILRVRPQGNDAANDGSTWSAALKTVQKALALAKGGDEVWVAAGTYMGALTLPRHVGLYGGFAGTEASREDRRPGAGTTILDGEAAAGVVTIQPGAMPDSVLDSLTITNGRAGVFGGGVKSEGAWPTLSGLTVSHSSAEHGGGISVVFGGARITGTVVTGNNATQFGGGLFVKDATVSICNSQVNGNTTPNRGGGSAIYRSRLTLANTLCHGNTADNEGGALFVLESTGDIINTTIADNTARFMGGGLFAEGSALRVANSIVAFNDTGLVNNNGTVNTDSCLIYGNIAADHIGMTLDAASLVMDPRFVNRLAADYHLQCTSPGINRGRTECAIGPCDLDGAMRVFGSAVDIGAYEYSGVLPWDDVRLALRICAGLTTASVEGRSRLDREPATLDGKITMADVLRLARNAAL